MGSELKFSHFKYEIIFYNDPFFIEHVSIGVIRYMHA